MRDFRSCNVNSGICRQGIHLLARVTYIELSGSFSTDSTMPHPNNFRVFPQVKEKHCNIQCSCGQVRLIRIEYSVIGLNRWAHSTLNIQCRCRLVRLIGIEYSVIGLNR
jgi:hypothetical protein